jgi:hypothetical protein
MDHHDPHQHRISLCDLLDFVQAPFSGLKRTNGTKKAPIAELFLLCCMYFPATSQHPYRWACCWAQYCWRSRPTVSVPSTALAWPTLAVVTLQAPL